MNRTYQSILYSLSTDSYISAKEIGVRALISERTVRNHIHGLSEYLEDYGAHVESRHRCGYRLVIADEARFAQLHASESQMDDSIPDNADARSEYIIVQLIEEDDRVSCDALMEHMYISDFTLQNDIARTRKILQRYDLKLSGNGLNLVLKGSEMQKRALMVSYANSFLNTPEVDKKKTEISGILLNELNQYKVSIPEISVENVITYLYIAMIRIMSGSSIDSEIQMDEDTSQSSNLSYVIAERLCADLQKCYGAVFSKPEISMAAVQLFGNRVTERYGIGNANVVISQDIYDLVHELLLFIKVTMKMDLTRNLNLTMNLSIHMVSMKVRLKYHIYLANPMIADIKKQYPLGYTIAAQIKSRIEQKFDAELNEDETAYLALIFEVSIKNENASRKKNILIVCATGKTSSELLAYQYREQFGSYLENIEVCNVSDLSGKDFQKIDYVVSTTPIHETIPVPIIQTRMMLSDEEEEKLKKTFRSSPLNIMTRYYLEKLFFDGIRADTKEDAIRELCRLIGKNKPLPDGFADSVLKRETFGSTDFGELVALAHPYGITTAETFAAVGILEAPVSWGNHAIRIVILISIADHSDNYLEEFYRKTSQFMLDRSKPKKLLAHPVYEELINLLEEE